MEKLISKRVMTSLQVVHSIFRRTQPFTKYELTAKFFVKRLFQELFPPFPLIPYIIGGTYAPFSP